ncbi:DNA (cytosine-5-)-methyltransferase [Carnobacterium mobile]|uniref:DNA (cytosine-5-)-methyltransferase n=1 Tax=Carnobacterium mobile TaxID=2750 RepID=UPI0018666A56|nr:DNA (cytosine-5-)-methyltransferase [Carnobacterium mobile]
MNKINSLNTLELFAGVGGFRVGLERADATFFNTKWSNQWEPARKAQDAFDCYNKHFPDSININEDIATLSDDFFTNLDLNLLVGGFPCQDYSVARSLSGGLGIQGKKGVLFWEIIRIARLAKPNFVLLENVDRLLKSPSTQRGRDFSIMLAAFNELGYSVEWRVINAAEYGQAQRRRRIFIFAYRNDQSFYLDQVQYEDEEVLLSKGFFSEEFPVEKTIVKNRRTSGELSEDIVSVSDNYSATLYNSGVMRNGAFTSIETAPISEKPITLNEILIHEQDVEEKYYLSEEKVEKFKYLRGPKKIERTSKDGHTYTFSEGGMSETDDLNKPGRTMLTSEGSLNRSTHLIKVNDRYRILTPVECERLNGFPDNWTKDMADRMRYFCMGNALSTGIIERIGKRIKTVALEKEHTISLKVSNKSLN